MIDLTVQQKALTSAAKARRELDSAPHTTAPRFHPGPAGDKSIRTFGTSMPWASFLHLVPWQKLHYQNAFSSAGNSSLPC
jgi:hypothetical protein